MGKHIKAPSHTKQADIPQPIGIVRSSTGLVLRCVKTEMGDIGEDGRRTPSRIEGSEHGIECGMIIGAVGQFAANEELAQKQMMDGDKVRTDFDTMRTADPQVFAAGDGAFGPSTMTSEFAT